MNTLDWLLDSDPAIRWQAMRYLTDAPHAAISAERARVAHEGIGARILACQAADGVWRRPDAADWVPTLFTMQLLRATGIDHGDPVVAAALARLENGYRWHEQLGHKTFFEGETEPCINGGVLALGGYFGRPSVSLVQRLLGEQLSDGGWNCEAPKSVRSSYHSTICVLEGLLEYQSTAGFSQEITQSRRRAEEYLLSRALFRRLSTGEVANPDFLKFSYPPRYHYDVLRALDYLRAAGVSPDERMREAVDIIRANQQAHGRWLLERSYDDVLALPLGETRGAPSRWITLRALRVLRWYDGAVTQN